MTRVDFDRLVSKLERTFAHDGPRLKKSALRWAALGYLILGVYLMLCLALLAVCVWLIFEKPGGASIQLGVVFGLAAGALALSIFRSLWSRLEAPEGREVRREEVPELYEMIDSVSEKAGGVAFHEVLLTDELNASVVQVARAGVFGLYRNHLSLGLPLLDILPPGEFRAVLAHEFAHLSGGDAKVSNWIYRIRQTWERVAEAIFNEGGWLNAPLRGFFAWFWPHFHARAFLLSRANEYRADRFAAEVASADETASALARIHLQSRNLEEGFWGKLPERLRTEESAPTGLFSELEDFLRRPVEKELRKKWLRQAYASRTDNSDTHPELKDRCAALGVSDVREDLEKVGRTATEAFLGSDLAEEVRKDFSRRWFAMTEAGWKEQRSEIAEAREKLRVLEEKGVPDRDGHWDRIVLRSQLDGAESVEPELRRFVAANPDHHLAAYLLGSDLLAKDEAEGLGFLEQAAKKPDLSQLCLEAAGSFHDRNGEHEALGEFSQKADANDTRIADAEKNLHRVTKKDSFVPHGLSETRLTAVLTALKKEPAVKKAWLVRRENPAFGDIPHYLLVLNIKGPWYRYSGGLSQKVIQRVIENFEFYDPILLINDEGPYKPIRKAVAKVPGSEINP